MNPSETIQIRRFEQRDVDCVVELCQLHAGFEQSHVGVRFCRQDLERLFLSDATGWFCLVVEEQSKVSGYATYGKQISTWNSSHYLYLDCLYLNESIRGKGIGARVMKFIGQEATRLECSHVEWQTPDFNKAAIGFYEGLGATGKPKVRFTWRL